MNEDQIKLIAIAHEQLGEKLEPAFIEHGITTSGIEDKIISYGNAYLDWFTPYFDSMEKPDDYNNGRIVDFINNIIMDTYVNYIITQELK